MQLRDAFGLMKDAHATVVSAGTCQELTGKTSLCGCRRPARSASAGLKQQFVACLCLLAMC